MDNGTEILSKASSGLSVISKTITSGAVLTLKKAENASTGAGNMLSAITDVTRFSGFLVKGDMVSQVNKKRPARRSQE